MPTLGRCNIFLSLFIYSNSICLSEFCLYYIISFSSKWHYYLSLFQFSIFIMKNTQKYMKKTFQSNFEFLSLGAQHWRLLDLLRVTVASFCYIPFIFYLPIFKVWTPLRGTCHLTRNGVLWQQKAGIWNSISTLWQVSLNTSVRFP